MFVYVPAGVWASKLGEMAGVKVPLIAMHHAYVVTERIEGIQVGNPSVVSEQLDCGSGCIILKINGVVGSVVALHCVSFPCFLSLFNYPIH